MMANRKPKDQDPLIPHSQPLSNSDIFSIIQNMSTKQDLNRVEDKLETKIDKLETKIDKLEAKMDENTKNLTDEMKYLSKNLNDKMDLIKKEIKDDRKWMVGTMFAVAGFCLAVVKLFF